MTHRPPSAPTVLTAVIAAGAALAVSTLAACGSSGGGAAPSTPSSRPSSSVPAPEGSASPLPTASTKGAPAPSAPATVNKTIEDPVLGDKTTVLKYIVGYQPSAAARTKYSALLSEQVVLVEVTVTAGSKYYGSFGADDFRLTAIGNGIDETATTILNSEVKAAGYPPLVDAQPGKSSTGWLVFTPQAGQAKLVLRYQRLAYKTSDGTSIPAKAFDVALN